MTTRELIFRYIENNFVLSYPIDYDTTRHDPGYTMRVVTDPESKQFLCDGTNESGEMILQFTFAASQASGVWTQFMVEDQLEELKNQVKQMVGQITVSGSSVRLYNNRTEGIRRLGDPDNLYFGALFETSVSWSNLT